MGDAHLSDLLDVTNMGIEDLEARNKMLEELSHSDLNLINLGKQIGPLFDSISTQDVMIFLFIILALLVFALLMLTSAWKIFEKAGKPGWEAIIPHHNIVVMLELVGKPTWWWFLIIVPFVNVILGIYVTYLLIKSFGYGIGVTIGVIVLPFIFVPWLAYGKATYHGH